MFRSFDQPRLSRIERVDQMRSPRKGPLIVAATSAGVRVKEALGAASAHRGPDRIPWVPEPLGSQDWDAAAKRIARCRANGAPRIVHPARRLGC